MRKLVISAFALAAMTSFAMAAEPVKLTSSQLDLVSAGNPCGVNIKGISTCVNSNFTEQTAVAVGGAAFSAFSGNAVATNVNATEQEISGD
jgi:hypothetical protein